MSAKKPSAQAPVGSDGPTEDETQTGDSSSRERVVRKITHLYKRLKRLSQQIKQLGDDPDPNAARSLSERLDRVSRGGIEDLSYAVETVAEDERDDIREIVADLAARLRGIAGPLADSSFDTQRLGESVRRMNVASEKMVLVTAEMKSIVGA